MLFFYYCNLKAHLVDFESDARSLITFAQQSANVFNRFGPLDTDHTFQKDFNEHIA